MLDQIVKQYNPRYIISMFSGGHDSLVATHIASKHPNFSFALHINTGIGIEQTREFVRHTCSEWNIELREYKATENTKADGSPDPVYYENLVLDYGFPGPHGHQMMYNKLKERQLRRVMRDLKLKRSDKVVLVTGVRSQESMRRLRNIKDPLQIDGKKLWVAVIHDYSKRQVNDYIQQNNLTRNPVVDMLHMSGECLCGAFAHKGELDEIKFWFPDMGAYIEDLERRVIDAGFPWGWEQGPPTWWKGVKHGQKFLPGGFEEMLCMSCNKDYEHANR